MHYTFNLNQSSIISVSEIIVEGGPVFYKFFSLLDSSLDQYREINNVLDLLKENPDLGDKIRRNLWPKYYVRKYGIHTLFRIKLNDGYRMIYTISGKNNSKIVTILDVLTHKEYEKRFRY